MGLVINSFKQGFDWLKLSKFHTWFAILLLLILITNYIPIIGILVAIVMGFVVEFIVFPKVLNNYKQKSPFGEPNADSFIAWLKMSVIKTVLPAINWRQKKILNWQLLAIGGVILFGVLGIIISPALLLFAGLSLAAGSILIVYNTLRYSQALPVRLVEKNSTFISFDRSWQLTEGKVLNVFGFELLLSVFSLAVIGISIGAIIFVFAGVALSPDSMLSIDVSNPLVLVEGIVVKDAGSGVLFNVIIALITSFITLVSLFAQANYYIGLKKAFVPRRRKR